MFGFCLFYRVTNNKMEILTNHQSRLQQSSQGKYTRQIRPMMNIEQREQHSTGRHANYQASIYKGKQVDVSCSMRLYCFAISYPSLLNDIFSIHLNFYYLLICFNLKRGRARGSKVQRVNGRNLLELNPSSLLFLFQNYKLCIFQIHFIYLLINTFLL